MIAWDGHVHVNMVEEIIVSFAFKDIKKIIENKLHAREIKHQKNESKQTPKPLLEKYG